jgi:5-methyltetrahydrofolate--homocysteine methyltransferase
MSDLSVLRKAILDGDAAAAAGATRKALAEAIAPVDLISSGISPAMGEVGKRFEEGEFFVPELLMAARATKEIFQILRPLLAQSGAASNGIVVLGTVRGDQHDIGKNLVGAMLEGGGFEIEDLGVDVPPEKFVAAVERKNPRILGLSALLTTTLPSMKHVVEAIEAAGMRGRLRIIVGGAPVTREFADRIGADGYGENALAAVKLALRLAVD